MKVGQKVTITTDTREWTGTIQELVGTAVVSTGMSLSYVALAVPTKVLNEKGKAKIAKDKYIITGHTSEWYDEVVKVICIVTTKIVAWEEMK